MRIAFFCTFFLLLSMVAGSQVVINEIMATNASSHMETDFYNFPDWIEIYNGGTAAVNMSGYYLSDDPAELKKWQFPSFMLNAGQYYLVYCDKEGTGSHTTFGLSADGEAVYLCDHAGSVIDYVEYNKQYPDISYGRNIQNRNLWLYCAIPTPGTANLTTYGTDPSPKAEFSIPAGRLSDASALSLTGSGIKYTTNGSEPSATSSPYIGAITLNKTTVVKTRTYLEGYLPSNTIANTYFVSEHDFTLPVVSLSYNPDYFYDNTYGIYTTGTNGITQIGNCPDRANFNQDWERAAYLEYFDENGIKKISQPVGMKIAGGCTRFYAQKSLSIYARDKYGNNDFDYPFFKQKPDISKVKSILLRNSGNDFNNSHLRDAFLQALVEKSLDLDLQAYQPAIAYFNGQYWGIMNIREKVDEDYYLSNYFISSDSIDFVEGNLMSDFEHNYTAIRGSKTGFTDIIAFVTTNSLVGDDNYNQVASRLDLREYLNYMAVQIYIANTDWPGNNLKLWKRSNNGKWRWILFDTDFGFGATSYNHQTIEFASATNGGNWPNPPWSTLLFRKLLENENFQRDFIRTMLTIRNTCFQPDWCNHVMDSLSARIDFEMTYHKSRWGGTKSDWYNSMDRLTQFATNRYNFIPGYLASFFNLSGEQAIVSVANPSPDQGDVAVNGSVIMHYPFSMKTYEEIDLTIQAMPAKGYNFSHWKYAGQATIKSILSAGSEWSYLDEATGYPSGWTSLSFNDEAWKKGNAQLGYGEGDEATVISYGPDASNKIPTALFRKKFSVTDTAGWSAIELELHADDGAVVYLNGNEVFRTNMPAGTVSFTTTSSEANDQVTVNAGISKASLLIGENVIACEVHQFNGTSSDLGFELSLRYALEEEPIAGIYSHEPLIKSNSSFNIALEPVFDPIAGIGGIYLNEIAPVGKVYRDESGEKSGFAEIYNQNSSDQVLCSFFISDDRNNLMRYAIPDSLVIPANGFLTFFLDGDAKQGLLHASFKADTDGESLYLSQKTGDVITILDSISFAFLVPDHSFGKYIDGTGEWQHMVKMTPGKPNDPDRLESPPEYTEFEPDTRIYPNPSDGNIIIFIDQVETTALIYSADVVDLCGKVVYPKVWLNSNKSNINLTGLNRGLYFVRVFRDKQLVNTGKILIFK